MKCDNCQITMTLDRTESSGNACAQWLKCPLCSRTHMVSQLKSDTQVQPDLVLGPDHINNGRSRPPTAQADTVSSMGPLGDEFTQQYSLGDIPAPNAGTQHGVEPEFFLDSLNAE